MSSNVHGTAPTSPSAMSLRDLAGWVAATADLTGPDRVQWCTGSDDEWSQLTGLLVDSGTFVRLDPLLHPDSFWCGTDPQDAEAEEPPILCCARQSDAGPNRRWVRPNQMRAALSRQFNGCMAGRVMYVVPYCMGSLFSEPARLGVQITDSPYVVALMRIMSRIGDDALARFDDGIAFVAGVHSVGAPLSPGEPDAPWPCSDVKVLAHFPESAEIWSYGSGHGGNLTAARAHVLGAGSIQAKAEGSLVARMLIAKLTAIDGTCTYAGAAFPEPSGAANLALLRLRSGAATLELIGADVAWLTIGPDGRLRARNPESGLCGIAPGTAVATNPDVVAALSRGRALYVNVALTLDGDVWWEGKTEVPPAGLLDWRGAEWTAGSPGPAAHPRSRYYTPISELHLAAREYADPDGVPLDVILFGAALERALPLVVEARNWQHGVFLGAAADAGNCNDDEVRRGAPMGSAGSLGYPVGEYLSQWLRLAHGADPDLLPPIFLVNWGIAAGAGGPRGVAWALRRLAGEAVGRDTPIGLVPMPGALDVSGLGLTPEQVTALCDVDPERWRVEVQSLCRSLDMLGPTVPRALFEEIDRLECLVAAFA